jgi:hypothetical protein
MHNIIDGTIDTYKQQFCYHSDAPTTVTCMRNSHTADAHQLHMSLAGRILAMNSNLRHMSSNTAKKVHLWCTKTLPTTATQPMQYVQTPSFMCSTMLWVRPK